MSSKLDLGHEKPEVVDAQQPTVKKVRLAVEAVTVLDTKESSASASGVEDATAAGSNDEDTSAENSPKADDENDENDDAAQDDAAAKASDSDSGATDEPKAPASDSAVVTTPNTKGSAFGGFAAFSGTSGFSAFAAASSSKSSSSGFGAFASAGNGFASFQHADTASFSSFGVSAESSSGFATTASAAESVEFGSSEVKKPEPTFVPALTDAEIANGEEGEQILIEKRAKLFKLVEQDYAEVGIGPLRLLKAVSTESATGKSSVRIVMRRESYPRGPGTKLLLNARLNACLACIEKTEKAMLLTIVESVSSTSSEASAAVDDASKSSSSSNSTNAPVEALSGVAAKITPSTYLIRFGSSDDFQSVLARLRPWLPSTAASSSTTSSS